jgi:hypothetical protein
MFVKVAGLMARVVMMRARLLRHTLITMSFVVEITRRVPWMVMMLAGNFLRALVPMTVLV